MMYVIHTLYIRSHVQAIHTDHVYMPYKHAIDSHRSYIHTQTTHTHTHNFY